jgi:hypothetical protein
MREVIERYLSNGGYAKKGEWFTDENMAIKLNKKSVTISTKNGVSLFRTANPDKITIDQLDILIQTAL